MNTKLFLLFFVTGFITFGQTTDNYLNTSGIKSLHPGGSSGYGLTGSGIKIGQWEASESSSQQVFQVRTSNTDLSAFTNVDVGSVSGHATTVAKYLAYKKTDSLGVAYNASIFVFDLDWNDASSFEDEVFWNELDSMAQAGMLVSNHSYASAAGWVNSNLWYGLPQIDSTEDFKFGRYGNTSRRFDSIANRNPYMLIVKPVDNDRGRSGTAPFTSYSWNGTNWVANNYSTPLPEIDGGANGFDGLPDDATSKNALVVGAVEEIPGGWSSSADVNFGSGGSAWGPTDDGRIKPDLVAAGGSSSPKTSYATPAITGTAALLQELYFSEQGKYLTSAQMKAVLIHGASEAGSNNGPDYQYGYGLLRADISASLIKGHGDSTWIGNGTLVNNDMDTIRVFLTSGSSFKATLAWNDPKGPVLTNSYASSELDRTDAILVNDLNLAFYDDSNVLLASPWVLDPSNPTNAATTGVNTRDNVEVIEYTVPTSGWYKLIISHTGTLSSGQSYGLVYSGFEGIRFESGSWSILPSNWSGNENVLVNDPVNVVSWVPNVPLNTLDISEGSRVHLIGNSASIRQVILRGSSTGHALLKGQVDGSVEVNEYWTGNAGYRHLSASVQVTADERFSSWQLANLNSGNSQSVWKYDNSTQTWTTLSVSDSLYGLGMASYMGSNANGTWSALPFTSRYTGSTKYQTTNISLDMDSDSDPSNANDGWNLVPNPFASNLEWDNISTSFGYSVWNAQNGSYDAWLNGAGTASGIISRGQSVFVYQPSSGVSNVQIDTSDAVFTAGTLYKSSSELRLTASLGDWKEVILLVFETGGDSTFDTQLNVVSKTATEPIFHSFFLNNQMIPVQLTKQYLNYGRIIYHLACPNTVKLSVQHNFNGNIYMQGEYGEVLLKEQMDTVLSAGDYMIRWKANGLNMENEESAPDEIVISANSESWSANRAYFFDVYDLSGRRIKSANIDEHPRFHHLMPGIYLLISDSQFTRVLIP